MPESRIGFYLRSPLIRNPTLLLRKIRERTGWLPTFQFSDPPASFIWNTDEALADSIRAWASACRPFHDSISPCVVFGHAFERRQLLAWCRNGVSRGNGIEHDIKVPWEFSRFYTAPLRILISESGDRDRLAKHLAEEISEWLDVNQNPHGPMWINAMEVAIRAINWMVADDLLGGGVRNAMGEKSWRTAMWHHGSAIEAHLEARLISSNHYLANLLGLLIIGQHTGHAVWRNFALREFPSAVMAQSYPDGGAYEASLPYHALITEMALLYVAATGNQCTSTFRRHVALMVNIIAAACRSSGEVFPVGDDDSGRVIAMDHIMKSSGRGQALLRLAEQILKRDFPKPNAETVFPHAGWWIGNNDHWHVLVEFGGVGFAGKGGHAHNDTLSLCVDWKGMPLLIDPGSFLYTGSPSIRNRYRATDAHNVLMINNQEQLPFRGASVSDLFSMSGPVRPSTIVSSTKDHVTVSHETNGVTHERSLQLDSDALIVRDRLIGQTPESLTWYFQIGPGIVATPHDDKSILLTLPDKSMIKLSFDFSMSPVIEKSEYAPSYGQSRACTKLAIYPITILSRTWTWQLYPC